MMGSSFLQDIISSLIERGTRFGGVTDHRSIIELCTDLRKTTGENAIKRLGATILEKYRALNHQDKEAFFAFLSTEMDVDAAKLSELALTYAKTGGASDFRMLMEGAEPKRQDVFRRLNHVPNGTHALVEMRKDLLSMTQDNEPLKRVDLDLSHLFASWFNPGFLVKQRVTWDSAASVLAKIIQYEAVHAINDWEDLRRRIQPPDRRCFAFFHPAMPNEPLVFVEVALCQGAPHSIQALLSEDRTPIEGNDADTAVFYSISNCQEGLRGISFGNSLIKQVVSDLAQELPRLATFITLSPVSGFSNWLASPASGLTEHERKALKAACESARGDDVAALQKWGNALRVLCARYLIDEKRADGLPVDPVARFHLNNGAALHAIHPMADISPNGLAQSGGVMVNYHYDVGQVEQRHETFACKATVHTSRSVDALRDITPDIPKQQLATV